MNEAATKTCPLCCETINAKARKCPHCQHFQNKWTLLAYHPLVAMAPMLVVIIGFAVFMQRIFDRGEDFDAHGSQIRVLQSAMEFGESLAKSAGAPATPTVAVVGTIQNDSGIAWKDVIIEVQFFDKDHKLIDTKQDYPYSHTLPKDEQSAFKVSMQREFSPEKYASSEVRVVSARDARGWGL